MNDIRVSQETPKSCRVSLGHATLIFEVPKGESVFAVRCVRKIFAHPDDSHWIPKPTFERMRSEAIAAMQQAARDAREAPAIRSRVLGGTPFRPKYTIEPNGQTALHL